MDPAEGGLKAETVVSERLSVETLQEGNCHNDRMQTGKVELYVLSANDFHGGLFRGDCCRHIFWLITSRNSLM